MKNIHIIYATFDINQVRLLAEYGIRVEAKYDRFDIEENETYSALKPYLDKWKVEDFIISEFSKEEMDAAEHLVILSPWTNGYPMPDKDDGYKRSTYDDSDYCNTCGVGLKQKESFRLKKAPNWGGHKKMFSLNWVGDELFVKKDFYESLFKPNGIKSEKVLLFKKETQIPDTEQLIIPESSAPLKLEGYAFEICKSCGCKRYDLIQKGFFPPFTTDVEDKIIFKSKEWFGTGASARKYIFVTAKLRQQLLESKVTANYIPCE